jgi:hypothetical protein
VVPQCGHHTEFIDALALVFLIGGTYGRPYSVSLTNGWAHLDATMRLGVDTKYLLSSIPLSGNECTGRACRPRLIPYMYTAHSWKIPPWLPQFSMVGSALSREHDHDHGPSNYYGRFVPECDEILRYGHRQEQYPMMPLPSLVPIRRSRGRVPTENSSG